MYLVIAQGCGCCLVGLRLCCGVRVVIVCLLYCCVSCLWVRLRACCLALAFYCVGLVICLFNSVGMLTVFVLLCSFVYCSGLMISVVVVSWLVAWLVIVFIVLIWYGA